jgi:site-specific recombinase XerD
MEPHSGAALGELAEDWLQWKDPGLASGSSLASDRARRGDLRRWTMAILEVQGRSVKSTAANDMTLLNNVTVTEIGSLDVVTQALRLLRNELAPSSCQRALSTLSGFSKWMHRRGHLAEDITGELSIKTGDQPDIEGFRPEHIVRLLEATQNPPSTLRSGWPTRDAAIVLVGASCGLRVSEICALSFSWLDRLAEQPLIRIDKAKGRKKRIVPVPSPTLTILDQYIYERAIHPVTPNSYVFIRSNGAPLNQQFIDTLLRRLCLTAGIPMPTGAMTHALRHSYGSELALRNLPTSVLQQLLGHNDPRTTSRYTRAHGTDLIHALNDAGWLKPETTKP